ncbi:MAG: BamA/TamA family outer membrane protein [Balneolales bacterium]|nr:BamA/TamA family outer membrane protein [Balneolales bacterium]
MNTIFLNLLIAVLIFSAFSYTLAQATPTAIYEVNQNVAEEPESGENAAIGSSEPGFRNLFNSNISRKIYDGTSIFTETGTNAAVMIAMDDVRRAQVRRVRMEGNETYPDMVLKDIIATEAPGFFRRMAFWRRGGFDYSETEVRRDIIRLQRFYQRRGFYDIAVNYRVEEGRKDHHRRIVFEINEGEPTIIRSFEIIVENEENEDVRSFIESRDFSRAQNRNLLSEDSRYHLIRHPDVESDFLNLMRNFGFPWAKSVIKADVDTVARQADLRLYLDPGVIAYFNEIEVDGVQTVPESLIRYQSAIREGDRFSQRQLREAQQLVFRHPLVRLTTIAIPEQEEDDLVDIRIRIREQSLRSIQVLAGFGNEDLLRGQVTWTHRNPFGNGHRFSATTRASFLEQMGNVEYLIPGFVNPRSNLSVSPFASRREESNFLITRYGFINNLSYWHSRELVGNISYEFSNNNELLNQGSGIRSDSTQVYNISSLKLSSLYNESTPDRGQGWAVRPFAEISGFLGTGSIAYQRLSLDVRRFIDLSSTTKIALRVDSGLLFSGDPFDTPANIRFYTGGTNSVRGWQRRELGPKRAVKDNNGNFLQYLPLGGQSMLMFNSEIRQDLPFLIDGLQIGAFLDGGQVWLRYQETNPADFQYGTGAGLRYNSPIGPVRIDFGYKLNPSDEDLNRFEGETFSGRSRWAVHFSIGQAF